MPTVFRSEVAQVVEGPLFTPHSIEILKEQLQMHLQLLVQHTVLAHDVDSLAKNKDIARTRIVRGLVVCFTGLTIL